MWNRQHQKFPQKVIAMRTAWIWVVGDLIQHFANLQMSLVARARQYLLSQLVVSAGLQFLTSYLLNLRNKETGFTVFSEICRLHLTRLCKMV